MSILDTDLRNDDAAYDLLVNHPQELDAAIAEVWRESRGYEPNEHDRRHVYWRIIREGPRWGTLREALRDERTAGGAVTVPPGKDLLMTGLVCVTANEGGPVLNRTYSYWSNAWVGPNGLVYVFIGHPDGAVRFYSIGAPTKSSPTGVVGLGPLLPYAGTGEGWYWDAEGWIYLCDGPRLRRVNPFTAEDVVVFNVSTW